MKGTTELEAAMNPSSHNSLLPPLLSFSPVPWYNPASAYRRTSRSVPGNKSTPGKCTWYVPPGTKTELCDSASLKKERPPGAAAHRTMYKCNYPQLFSAIKLGNTVFRNRIFAAPLGYCYTSSRGYPLDETGTVPYTN